MAFTPPPELLEVLSRIRAGDGPACSKLDALLRARLRCYFRCGPWPSDEAEDLVQTTLVRVFQHLDTLAQLESFWPWLYSIARHVRLTAAAQWSERRAREAVGLESVTPERAESSPSAPQHQLASRVERALASLPARQRQCLRLHLREELSYTQIAALLRISEHTVRNHLAAAREALRTALAAPQESP
jgi:RNA polymerase sigma-70 factor (ECF subfamily)